jgi:hypothetical protein
LASTRPTASSSWQAATVIVEDRLVGSTSVILPPPVPSHALVCLPQAT